MWMEVMLVNFNLAVGWLMCQIAKFSSHKQYIAIMYRTVEETHHTIDMYCKSRKV